MTAALQIRSITLGLQATHSDLLPLCSVAGAFLSKARRALSDGGFTVQTTRLCTQPIHELVEPADFPAFALALETACGLADIDYCAAGGIQVDGTWTEPETAAAVSSAITATERFFTSIRLDGEESADPRAARAAAAAIKRIAQTTDQGFGNLRFAGVARCPANVPFFPAAFHAGARPRFTIAAQWADLLLQATQGANNLPDAAERITGSLSEWGGAVERICASLELESGFEYGGLDLTPAPFPSDVESVGAAIESLGVEELGAPGTLTAVAALTRTLKSVPLRRAGFSGIMLPVLEDSVLARRVSEGRISISELLLYSAVCGTGLDTIPLPGDIALSELAGLLADVATLAVTLDKPLTARLFPVVGRLAGDMTEFDFPFFANGRVMATKGVGSQALLARIPGVWGLRPQVSP